QHSGSKKRIHRLFVSDGDTRPRAKRCKAPFRPPKPSETSESDEGIQTLIRSRWGKKDQFTPPVFLPGGFVMAGIERLFLPEADGGHHGSINAELSQFLANGERPLIAKSPVVFFCPAFVAMPLDAEGLSREFTFHPASDLFELWNFTGFDDGLIKFKIDRLV